MQVVAVQSIQPVSRNRYVNYLLNNWKTWEKLSWTLKMRQICSTGYPKTMTEPSTSFDSPWKDIAFPIRKRYIIDVEKLNQQRFNYAPQV